jgi:chemotaxis protein MotB
MAIEDEPPAGTPEWMVTYSDMMSLLLTFFILLVSLSEIKKNDRFQGIADSIQHHFGHESTRASSIPGESRPSNSELASLAVTSRTKRMSLLGFAKDGSSQGPESAGRIIRPEERTTVGTTISFAEAAIELSEANQEALRAADTILQGKQKIEIRATTASKPASRSETLEDSLDLAYERCRQTFAFLARELSIDPARIRITVAASNEPLVGLHNPQQLAEDNRVEVFLLE